MLKRFTDRLRETTKTGNQDSDQTKIQTYFFRITNGNSSLICFSYAWMKFLNLVLFCKCAVCKAQKNSKPIKNIRNCKIHMI